MATLSNSLSTGTSPAIIIPGSRHVHISADQIRFDTFSFQQQLARLSISSSSAVSIALPNSYEFIVAFLATTWQRGIAAPLNPSYTQDEFEFYIGDLNSALVLVPRGTFERNVPAVKAARRYNAAIAEVWFDEEVVFEIKELGGLFDRGAEALQNARP